MKTKKTSSSVFSSTIKAISYAANQAQEAMLHHNYSNPMPGDGWDDKFSQELFHKYIPEELINQVKLDHTYAEEQLILWDSLMHEYTKPRCYIDKVSVGDLIQYAITKKTEEELKKHQEKIEDDYKTIYTISVKDSNIQRIILSVNWRLQKLFPEDRVIKTAVSDPVYKQFILSDPQVDFIAQNYMDLVRYGWVYK